jgi:hypothetical protein
MTTDDVTDEDRERAITWLGNWEYVDRIDSLAVQFAEARRAGEMAERERVIAWLWSQDARRYTEVGPLVAKAIQEGRCSPKTP